MGRHSTYTDQLADAICAEIAKGTAVKDIGKIEGFPSPSVIWGWASSNPAFQEKYAHAKSLAVERMAEEIQQIADDGANDYYEDSEGNRVVNHDHIQRSRLRVDTRKWLLSKLAPKKYGERLELAGDKAAPLTVTVIRQDIP